MPGFALAAGRVSDTEPKPKIESYRPPALVMPTPEFDALAARNALSQSPTAAGTAQRAEKALRGRGCESSPTHAKKIARDRPSATAAAGRLTVTVSRTALFSCCCLSRLNLTLAAVCMHTKQRPQARMACARMAASGQSLSASTLVWQCKCRLILNKHTRTQDLAQKQARSARQGTRTTALGGTYPLNPL
jgi:hypothetical protein